MAKKDKKPKLPKKVGGVKLPKQLRKSAGIVAEIAQSPIAREVVSAALAAGAGALAKRKVKDAAGITTPTRPNTDIAKLMAQGSEIGDILAKGVSAFFNALTKPSDKAAAPAPVAAEPVAAVPKPRPKAAPKAKSASRARANGKTTPSA